MKPVIKFLRFILLYLILVLITSGCATYYQQNLVFQDHFVSGEIEEANKVLDKTRKKVKKRDQLLYYLQKGVVLQMLGAYEESNTYLERAYIFADDYRKNPVRQAAALLTNPSVTVYTGEDHELVLIHYYKALNFLKLGDYEAALVECRRLNNRLNYMNDRYERRKNRYRQDAFAMNLMGIVYEASGDVNNAFIAYRNAYAAYKEDYRKYFNTAIPLQLKKDLLRTAYLNGFYTELDWYEREFNMNYEYRPKPAGELVFFWHNGLGPIKDEWSVNFFIVKGEGGGVIFENEEYGWSFPFYDYQSGKDNGGLGDLKFIRVAFPKYLERIPVYRSAELSVDAETYPMEKAENINAIALSTLEDRMLREMGNALLRLALKQAAEEKVRDKNKHLGALLSVINATTEKADTRNWQTLPYNIFYARVPLPEGNNEVRLKTYAPREQQWEEHIFEFQVDRGETLFQTFHSLESYSPRLAP